MVGKTELLANLNRNIDFIKAQNKLRSDDELCRKIKIAKGTLSSVRKGKTVPKFFPFFQKICDYSGYGIDELISSDLSQSVPEPAEADEATEQEFKKYEGVYAGYYFDTKCLKGREREDDREAVSYAVILISSDENSRYACIADFGLTREQQEERYNACFSRNANGKTVRIRNFRSEFVNRYIGDNLYDGTFSITDGLVVMKLESAQDCVTMMMNKAANNSDNSDKSNKFSGGLAATISLCKGMRPVPVMQVVGLSRGIVSDSPEMIADKLYLSYPSIKCQEEDEKEIFQMIRYISDEHRESVSRGSSPFTITRDQERVILRDAMNRAINRTVKRNLARTIRITEKDDNNWNHLIIKREEV